MSLLTLLMGILSALAPLAGINIPRPEPAAAPLPARELVLEPQCDRELSAREEERMLAAIRYRCELVGLRGVQVRPDGGKYILQVNSGLITRLEEYTDTLDELESILNERTSMQMLRVHPNSEILVLDGEVQELLVAYETAVVAYEENHAADEAAPRIPALPARLRLSAYMLAEQQVLSQEDGSTRFEYMVVQRPEAAAEDEVLLTELEVERAELEPARNAIFITFTQQGGDILSRLTRQMKKGRERLAILINGVVVSAPIVHAELGCSCTVTGMSQEQCNAVVDGLAMPLPVPVRVTSRRSVD